MTNDLSVFYAASQGKLALLTIERSAMEWSFDDSLFQIRMMVFSEIPNHTNETLELQNKTTHSIGITWQHIRAIPDHLADFYGYLIEYKEVASGAHYTTSGLLNYSSDARWRIENLKIKTLYDIKLTPFRRYGTMTELATPYHILRVQTDHIGKMRTHEISITNETNTRHDKGLLSQQTFSTNLLLLVLCSVLVALV